MLSQPHFLNKKILNDEFGGIFKKISTLVLNKTFDALFVTFINFRI